jgi:hypothetical protein
MTPGQRSAKPARRIIAGRNRPEYARRVEVARHIVCVDCGGRCHLLSYEPHEGWEPGDVAAYRCEDCLDRWDLVLEDDDDDRDQSR